MARTATDYTVEKHGDSWAVWTCSPATGHQHDLVSWHKTKRAALRAVARCYTRDLNAGKPGFMEFDKKKLGQFMD